MEKNRLEAFSDGVLAIIITIMILELRQPAGDSLKDLLALGPTLLAYLLSFLFISIYWINHHHIFRIAEQINVKILWCNIAWLFFMSFIPFATAWIGTYPASRVPIGLYFADMFLASVSFLLMYGLILRERGERFEWTLRGALSPVIYFLAAALGPMCPVAAYIAVAAVSFWWIFPERARGK